MPLSKARRSRRTDLSSSTSPHQPVLTVQTPKPTSDTRMSVSPRLRYSIYRPLVSYLEHILKRATLFYRHPLLMCLRVLESIRSDDTDSLRSRISLRRIDPPGRLGQGSSGHVILCDHHLPIVFSMDEELTDERVLFAAERGLECIVEAQLQDVRLRFAADYQSAARRTRLAPDCPDSYSALYYQLARLMVDERPWTNCVVCGRPMIRRRSDHKSCGDACRQAKHRRSNATRESSR